MRKKKLAIAPCKVADLTLQERNLVGAFRRLSDLQRRVWLGGMTDSARDNSDDIAKERRATFRVVGGGA